MGDILKLFGLLIAVGAGLILPYLTYVLIQKHLVRGGASGLRADEAAELRALRERVARLEQAVDVVAVEVERVGEAQRFTDRLVGAGARGEAGAPAER